MTITDLIPFIISWKSWLTIYLFTTNFCGFLVSTKTYCDKYLDSLISIFSANFKFTYFSLESCFEINTKYLSQTYFFFTKNDPTRRSLLKPFPLQSTLKNLFIQRSGCSTVLYNIHFDIFSTPAKLLCLHVPLNRMSNINTKPSHPIILNTIPNPFRFHKCSIDFMTSFSRCRVQHNSPPLYKRCIKGIFQNHFSGFFW